MPARWLMRFFVGGVIVTAAAGAVAQREQLGSLLLVLPAILPPSLTLVQDPHGSAAQREAQGATAGALALATLGSVGVCLGGAPGVAALSFTLAIWGVVGSALWAAFLAPASRRNLSP